MGQVAIHLFLADVCVQIEIHAAVVEHHGECRALICSLPYLLRDLGNISVQRGTSGEADPGCGVGWRGAGVGATRGVTGTHPHSDG